MSVLSSDRRCGGSTGTCPGSGAEPFRAASAAFRRLFGVLIAFRMYRTGSGLRHFALLIRVMEAC
jgi:hypothetical protein